MARMLDDTARAKLLSSLLDAQGGSPMDADEDAPTARGPMAPLDQQYNDPSSQQINRGMPQPPQGQQGEPMVPVPASLAHAGMAALMQQASSNSIGRSLGSDGAGRNSDDGSDPSIDAIAPLDEQYNDPRSRRINERIPQPPNATQRMSTRGGELPRKDRNSDDGGETSEDAVAPLDEEYNDRRSKQIRRRS